MSHIRSLLEDFRLTTAEVIYGLPDYPSVLQSFIWQDYDLPPNLPKLMRFLEFWSQSIEGKLHSVHVMCAAPMAGSTIKAADFLRTIR